MRCTAILLGFLLLFSHGAVAEEPSSGKPFVGRWYGERYEGEPKRLMQWLRENNDDGSFVVEFRIYDNCVPRFKQVQWGHWTFDGRIFRVLITRVDDKIGDSVVLYDVSKISDREVDYRRLESPIVFHVGRVDAEFQIPARGCAVS